MNIPRIPFLNKHEPGFHVIIDVFFRDFPDDLHNLNIIKEKMKNVARLAQLNVIKNDFHVFDKYGLTGFYILSESHLAFHTWPEHKYIAIDLFTCGTQKKTSVATKAIEEQFIQYRPKKIKIKAIRRGFVYDNKS